MPAVLSPLSRACCIAVLLVAGCSVVRVEPGSGPSFIAALSTSVPGDDGLSARTVQELHRLDLYRLFPDSLGDLASRLHDAALNDSRPDLLFALAEVNNLRGRILEKEQDPRATICYFRAAGYAYHFLFGKGGVIDSPAAAFDPRFRLACEMYNTTLARCLVLACTSKQMDPRGRWLLPGREADDPPVNLAVAHVGLPWQTEELGSLTLCSAFKIKGLGIPKRGYGVGVPLVGQRDANVKPRPFVPAGITFPVTAFCRFEGDLNDLVERPRARMEFINTHLIEVVKINEHQVPLETDLATPLACYLGQAHVGKAAYLSFFKPTVIGEDAGLRFLEPYTPGKIPVVLVHGLLSSPQTWAPVINELQNDPVIRRHFRIGVYFFPTGEPYLATAADLRRDLANYRAAVDPEGKDAALYQTVLAGHSMGGLISRLLTIDSGDDFWQAVSPMPFDELHLAPQTREHLQRLYFFRRDPGVRAVVFFATPHGGSDLSPSAVGRLAASIAGVPRQLLLTTHEVLKHNPQLRSSDCNKQTSVAQLNPGAPTLHVLAQRPRPEGVNYHSVVGMAMTKGFTLESCFGGDGQGGDGVVLYNSAHLDDVQSELVVQSAHYHVHHHPLAVRELHRILRAHLEAVSKPTPAAK